MVEMESVPVSVAHVDVELSALNRLLALVTLCKRLNCVSLPNTIPVELLADGR